MKYIRERLRKYRYKIRTYASKKGRATKPRHLVLRFGKHDQPHSFDGEKRKSLAEMQKLIAETVAESKELPVVFWAIEQASDPLIPLLIRFAHRLECPTILYSDGSSITEQQIVSWFSNGLDTVIFGMAGISQQTHQNLMGNDIEEVTAAIALLAQLRLQHSSKTTIEIWMPWAGDSPSEAHAVWCWAMERGVDAFRIVVPKRVNVEHNYGAEKNQMISLSNSKHKTASEVWEFLQQDQPQQVAGSNENHGFCMNNALGDQRLDLAHAVRFEF